MKKIKITNIILLIFFLSNSLFSQRNLIRDTKEWRKYRFEVIFGAGFASYDGDIGGGIDDALEHLSVGNWQASLVMPAVHVGFRYKIYRWMAVNTNFAFTYIKGDDSKSNDRRKFIRNLSFRTPITELSTQLEFSIIKEKFSSMSKVNRFRTFEFRNINTYLFIGIGGFMFNPQAKLRNKDTNDLELFELQKMGTEGQGIGSNPPLYNLMEICMPLGIGFKGIISERFSVGIEFGYRFTNTDYIDDASNMYFDNVLISETYGENAARLADRHLNEDGLPSATKYPRKTLIRGDPDNNDSYMFLTFSIIYRLRNDRTGWLF